MSHPLDGVFPTKVDYDLRLESRIVLLRENLGIRCDERILSSANFKRPSYRSGLVAVDVRLMHVPYGYNTMENMKDLLRQRLLPQMDPYMLCDFLIQHYRAFRRRLEEDIHIFAPKPRFHIKDRRYILCFHHSAEPELHLEPLYQDWSLLRKRLGCYQTKESII